MQQNLWQWCFTKEAFPWKLQCLQSSFVTKKKKERNFPEKHENYKSQWSHSLTRIREKCINEQTMLYIRYRYLLITASTMTWIGFWSVKRWMISIACLMMRTANNFFPLFLPCIIRELVILSTIGHWAFLNLLAWYLPAVWGMYVGCFAAVAVM